MLVSELLGTSLLVVTFSLTILDDVLTNAVMYFLCVLLTFQTSFAQLNPAITLALYIRDANYKQDAFLAGLIVSAQIVGAFLGLELAMLMRLVYTSNGVTSIYPTLPEHLPGIQQVVGDNQWLTVMFIDGLGAFFFTLFYLFTIENRKDFV